MVENHAKCPLVSRSPDSLASLLAAPTSEPCINFQASSLVDAATTAVLDDEPVVRQKERALTDLGVVETPHPGRVCDDGHVNATPNFPSHPQHRVYQSGVDGRRRNHRALQADRCIRTSLR